MITVKSMITVDYAKIISMFIEDFCWLTMTIWFDLRFNWLSYIFKNGQSLPLFLFMTSFQHVTIQIESGVLRIRTRGRRIKAQTNPLCYGGTHLATFTDHSFDVKRNQLGHTSNKMFQELSTGQFPYDFDDWAFCFLFTTQDCTRPNSNGSPTRYLGSKQKKKD